MFSALFTNSVAVISWQSIYKWIKPKFICMSSITGERLSIKLHRKQFGSIGSELRTLTLIGNDCKVRYKFNVHTFVATTWVWSYDRWVYLYLCNQYSLLSNFQVRFTTLSDNFCQWLAADQWLYIVKLANFVYNDCKRIHWKTRAAIENIYAILIEVNLMYECVFLLRSDYIIASCFINTE